VTSEKRIVWGGRLLLSCKRTPRRELVSRRGRYGSSENLDRPLSFYVLLPFALWTSACSCHLRRQPVEQDVPLPRYVEVLLEPTGEGESDLVACGQSRRFERSNEGRRRAQGVCRGEHGVVSMA
jgi:hypothetical protein